MEALRRDLLFSLRALAKSPGLASIAILTLALGIGANTALFSVINAILLRTLPVSDPQQLAVLSDPESAGMQVGVNDSGDRPLFSYHEFEGLRDQNTAFTGIFATDSRDERVSVALNEFDEGSPAQVLMVSGGYFPVLDIRPMAGRTFGPEMDQNGSADKLAVISYAFWRRRMQGDPAVIGRKLRLRQSVFEVIGVAPPDFTGVMVGAAPDMWVPLHTQTAILPGRDWLEWKPGSITKTMFLHVVGRLRPGVSLSQANASINVTFQQVLQAEVGTIANERDRKKLLDSKIVARDARHGLSVLRGEYARPLGVLMGMVGLLLLLACANVATLLLARAASRQRELAMRVALGAGRGRLVRQLLTESVLLSACGGVVGLLLAQWAVHLLLRMVSSDPTPIPLDVHLDVVVLSFTLGVTLLTGILFGLAPALRATRLDLNQILRGSSRSISGSERGSGRLPMGKVLVGLQVAISLLLLVTAGLFVRSLQKLASVPLGYEADHLLLFSMHPAASGYKGPAIAQLYRGISQRISAVPGVRGATFSENGLFTGRESGDQISIVGYTPKSGQQMHARFDQIGPGYFSTIGIPILMGRDVSENDSSGARRTWLNQTMARYYFGDSNPIGQHIRDEYPETRLEFEVAGVVADAKYNALRGDTPRRFYVPFLNGLGDPKDAVFEVRYAGDSAAVSAALRRIVREADATLDPLEVRTIPALIDRRLVRDRLTARLSSFFGAIALLVACIGLYGVLSYTVARRTSEIGVRMALGAQRRDVLRLVLGEAALVTAVGALVGLGAALAGTRVLASMLYGLTARDPSTLVGAAVVLVAVALVAAAFPAWRASRVDPMNALRNE